MSTLQNSVTLLAPAAGSGSGSGSGQGGSGSGSLFGDMYVIERDLDPNNSYDDPTPGDGNGEPIRDVNGNPILIGSDGEPIYYVLDSTGAWVLDPARASLAVPVELGRANVARAPDSVMQNALDDAIATIDAAKTITTDAAGRIVCDGVEIDSPNENLALYQALMTAGHATGWPAATAFWGDATWSARLLPLLGADPTNPAWDPSALLGAAFDKSTPISLDAVLYEDTILGINTVTSEVDNLKNPIVDYYTFNNDPGVNNVASETYNYNRVERYAHTWIKWLADPESDGNYTYTAPVTVLQAVFNGNDWFDQFPAGGVNDFAQAVDDSRAVILFMHDTLGATLTTQPTLLARDFNADGQSDILWRDVTTGNIATWTSDSTGGYSYAGVGSESLGWQVAGTGDANDDGKSDIYWHNSTTGDAGVYLSNGTGGFEYKYLGTAPTDWQIAGVADFNNDGYADILWRSSTGGTELWQTNPQGGFTYANLGDISPDWKVAATADLNGDGITDILWRNTANGDTEAWFAHPWGVFTFDNYGAPSLDWQVAGAGDMNGDGKADILWRNTVSGDLFEYESSSSGQFIYKDLGVVSKDWQVSQVGDFNRDGYSDILWSNTVTGDHEFWFSKPLGGFSYADAGKTSTNWQVVA
jgi:hypothetical protein